jgi:hypothetical protein
VTARFVAADAAGHGQQDVAAVHLVAGRSAAPSASDVAEGVEG